MKKKNIAAILLMLCFSFSITAQPYKPFPEENARWYMHMCFITGETIPPCYNWDHAITGDTIVNGTVYHNAGVGLFRVDGLKVYYLNPSNDEEMPMRSYNFPGKGEVLLYDYELEVGDEYTYAYDLDGNPHKAVVSSITSTVNNGYRIRQWDFTYTSSPFYRPVPWLEGIGSWVGFFPTESLAEYYEELCAYDENGVTYYGGTSPYCGKPLSLESKARSYAIHLYPNPSADGTYTIDLEENGTTPQELEVYNAAGTLILRVQAEQYPISFSLSNQPAGMYVLRMKADEQWHRQTLLKL